MSYSRHNRPEAVTQALRFIYAEPLGYHQGARLRGRKALTPQQRAMVIREKRAALEKLP